MRRGNSLSVVLTIAAAYLATACAPIVTPPICASFGPVQERAIPSKSADARAFANNGQELQLGLGIKHLTPHPTSQRWDLQLGARFQGGGDSVRYGGYYADLLAIPWTYALNLNGPKSKRAELRLSLGLGAERVGLDDVRGFGLRSTLIFEVAGHGHPGIGGLVYGETGVGGYLVIALRDVQGDRYVAMSGGLRFAIPAIAGFVYDAR